jgi:hypothetical protein
MVEAPGQLKNNDISVILEARSNVKTVLDRLYYEKYNARAALLHL